MVVVVGLGLLLASVILPLFLGQWWWEPEVGVARDGGTHRVEVEGVGEPYAIWSDQSLIDPVCTLTGDDGAPIGTTPVPRDERVFLEEPWVAVPEASSTFTAPADGVVVATCDAVDVTPVQELHLAPLHPRIYYDAIQYGLPLLGLLLILGGIALAVVTAIRRPARV
jgi:hypothetical protein